MLLDKSIHASKLCIHTLMYLIEYAIITNYGLYFHNIVLWLLPIPFYLSIYKPYMLWCYLRSSLFHTRPEITTQADLSTILRYQGCTLTYAISHTDFTLCEMFTCAWTHSTESFSSAVVPSKTANTTGRGKVVQGWNQHFEHFINSF